MDQNSPDKSIGFDAGTRNGADRRDRNDGRRVPRVVFDPSTDGVFPACPFYSMTGYACPGCGMTRGLHALLHGHVLTALDYNLILPGILFFFGYLFVSMFLIVVRGRGLDFKIFKPWVIWSFFIFALVFTVLRNLPYYPFNILFP